MLLAGEEYEMGVGGDWGGGGSWAILVGGVLRPENPLKWKTHTGLRAA